MRPASLRTTQFVAVRSRNALSPPACPLVGAGETGAPRAGSHSVEVFDPHMSALPDVSQSTFQTDVLASDKPVLVDFWAPWCGPCKMLAPVVEKVAGVMHDRITFVKLNTDDAPSLAGEYQVSGIPCLILFKGGKAVDRIVGFVNESTITSMLNKHLAAA
jgi:thioredoxin 1